MKLKPLSLFNKYWLRWKKQSFIKRYAPRYLHEQLAAAFFDQLWQMHIAEHRLYVGPNRVAADLPITLVLGEAQSGKSSLILASHQVLPQSSYLNSEYAPIAGRSMPRCFVTPQKYYLELPQYFLINESVKQIPYLEQLLLFFDKAGYVNRIRQVVFTISLSKLLNFSEENARQMQELWHSTILLLSKLNHSAQIYFVVTEMDRLQGFIEYFSDLSLEERQHAFGFSLNSGGMLADQIQQQFYMLMKRMQRRMWWRCQSEHVLSRRLLVAEFPRQFNQLSENLLHYLRPFILSAEKNPLLQMKACLFVSTTQHGDVFDLLAENQANLVLESAAQNLPMLSQKREYFLRGFFQYLGVFTARTYVAAAMRSEKPLKKKFSLTMLSSKPIWIFFIFCILLVVASLGFWSWAKWHLYAALQKDPIVAYRILASDYELQNANAFVGYELPILPKSLQQRLASSSGLHEAIQSNTLRYLNQRWQVEVYQFYQKNIAGKYPLVSTAKQDVPVGEFDLFYAPRGMLSNFDRDYFQSAAVQNLLSKDMALINLYQQVKKMYRLMYVHGALGVTFMVYPNTFGANVKEITLTIAGTKLMLRPEGLSAGTFYWPNQQVLQTSGFDVQYTQASPYTEVYTGDWSWLRFFNSLHWKIADSESDYIVTPTNGTFSIQLNGHQALAELPALFTQLTVPEKLS